MKTKKIISIIIAAALICSTAACGPGSSSGGGAPPPPPGAGATGSPGAGGSSNGSAQSPDATTSPTTSPDTDGNAAGTSPSPDENPDPGNAGNSTSPSPPDTSPDTSPESGGSGAGLTGAPEDILERFVDDLRNAGAEMPMSMPPSAVTAEESQNAIGLSEADFEQYVAAAAQSIAAIGTFAHQIVLYQAVDANAAGQIKRLVSDSGGYDPGKWICVFPETVVVVDSGSYVLLVASYREVAEIALEVFEATAGSTGEAITFWNGV